MSAPEVSSVIDSILSAFRHGMEIFRKMPKRRHKRRTNEYDSADEEKKVHQSLSTRPREIQARYESSVAKHGRQFEVGDPACQTNLAHVLLVLNTGLVKLLNRALSSDAKQRSLSRKSLLSLSEVAAADTLSALSELNSRLSVASSLSLVPLADRHDPRAQVRRRHTSPQQTNHPKKRPAPNPLLAKGGWVRSRSGSSVVSVVPAVKPRSPNRHNHERSQSMQSLPPERRSTRPYGSQVHLPGTAPLAEKQFADFYRAQPPPQEAGSNRLQRRQSAHMQRPPSMLIVPSDFFDSTQNYYSTEDQPAPPRPPKIPLHSRPNMVPQRRPPSMMTFRTGSTKIGEIPEHRLPDRILSAEDQERIPMPYSIPLPLGPPKRKGRGFKFWKKPEITQPAAA